MSNFRISKKYAQGLWDYVEEVKETEILHDEMSNVKDLIINSKELKLFFENPIIDSRKKVAIVKEIFKSFSKTFFHFVQILIKNKRESQLLGVAEQFIAIYNKNNNIVKVEITSVKPLNKEQLDKVLLKANISSTDKVILTNKIDPDIIGGYILRKEGEQLNASVKTQFNNIRNNFENSFLKK